MANTPTEVTIDVKFNSREMQEWLAQAWAPAGYMVSGTGLIAP